MNSLNFRAIPLTTLEKTLKYGMIFQNALSSESLARIYLDKASLFAFTDHTKKGLKYVLEVRNKYLTQVKAFRNNEGAEWDENELFSLLKKNGIAEKSYAKEVEQSDALCPAVLEERNTRIEQILKNYPWISHATICAIEEDCMNVELGNDKDSLSLEFSKNIFSSEELSETEKSFMVENNVTEQNIQELESSLKKLVSQYPVEMVQYIFSYERERGLLKYE